MLESIPDIEVTSHEATGAREALEVLARHAIDLVFVDYHLGGETGISALAEIRAAGHECPVVLLTGSCDQAAVAEARRAGAGRHLPKNGLTTAALREVLVNALPPGGER